MHSYQNTNETLDSLFQECISGKGYSIGQSLCFIEEEYFPWRTNNTTWQLCFYVLLLKKALEMGMKEIAWDLDYIEEKARNMLSDESILVRARSDLKKAEIELLISDIELVKNQFLKP